MKNYKETSKKSYHELMEENDDKKGFKRSNLPRKRSEVAVATVKDDEPMISMAKSEAFAKRDYDPSDRKPYAPRKSTDYRKPYNNDSDDKKTGGYSTGYKKPYDPNAPKKPYDPNRPARTYDPNAPRKPYDPNAPRKPYDPNAPKKPYDPNRPARPYDPNRPTRPFDPNRPAKPYKKPNENS